MNRRDAETQSSVPGKETGTSRRSLLVVCLLLLSSLLQLSCASKPTDLKALVPADTLVYLETNDLGAAIQPIVDSKPFNEVAKYKPDLSAIKDVQLAVAVTGFETTEEKLNDEQSVGNIRPHFVAVADTHAWNWQAVGFAEKKLGSFVESIYDSEPTLEKSDKNGGKYFIWTAKDGRKAYALVIDSLIYFGNDESSIDKCLSVKHGETDSIAKAGKVPASEPGTLASGYVGPDGIAQIANVVGLKLASEASEESEVQSAIASMVPQLLRNSITGISWTAKNTELGLEDKYLISMPHEIAVPLANALKPYGQIFLKHPEDFTVFPPDAQIVTLYSLHSPLKAWQTVISIAQQQTDALGGMVIGEISKTLLSQYGVRDPQKFLDRLDEYIFTAKFDDSGDGGVLIASEGPEIRLPPITSLLEQNIRTTDEGDYKIFVSDDGELKAAIGRSIILGDSESVSRWIKGTSPENPPGKIKARFLAFDKDFPSVLSFGQDRESAAQIANVISEAQANVSRANSDFTTQTKLDSTGIERRTVTDFGLIGSIIAQLAQD